MSKKKNNTFILNKYSFLIISGFILEIFSTILDFYGPVVRNTLLIAGLALIFVGMILVRKDNPYSDRKESLIAGDIGFNFGNHFEEYRNVLSRKTDSVKYSTWRDDLLKRYNTYGVSDPGKKPITQDIRYYLKERKRRSEEKIDTVKTILIPAEFGIVASVYELDIGPLTGEMKFVMVLILSAALCLLCSVEINSGNKIVKFIDDFSEVLEIPLGQ